MMNDKRLKLTFYGGAGSVTGANFLIEEIDGLKILLDCGLVQGVKVCDDQNMESFPYDPTSIDYLFVSHAHLDHVGRIPKLVKDGFKGKIYSTPPTKDISEVLLVDSLGVMTKEAQRDNHAVLYEENDVKAAMALWHTVGHDQTLELGGFKINLKVAGHILGSSMTEIVYDGKKILYTGDLGNTPSPFLKDTVFVKDIDYLMIESVYGDRNHQSRKESLDLLEDTIENTVRSGGTLMIPAFSIEKTQEVLYEIKRMMEESRIPLIRVFLDSPLAINVTKIYAKYSDYYNEEARNIFGGDPKEGIFTFPQLHQTLTTDDSKAINNVKGAKIIIAGSGMSNGGRILHHEKRYLPDPKSTLLMMGYQSAGTLGRRIQDGASSVKIHGEEVEIKAKVVTLSGYSAHKGGDELFDFVNHSADSLDKVFVVLGEPRSSLYMVQRIRDNLAVSAVSPTQGETVFI